MGEETEEIKQLPFLARWLARLIPMHDSPPEMQFKWRVRVGLSLVLVMMWTSLYTLAGFGLWPVSIVFPGFAKAGELTQLTVRIERKEARDLDQDILDLRIKHCNASTPEAKQLYWSKIAPMLSDYQSLTGRVYQLPSCADL